MAAVADEVRIAVDDDGTGIARSAYEEAFKPFTRLDPARHNAKGGGSAIARDIAWAHGGT